MEDNETETDTSGMQLLMHEELLQAIVFAGVLADGKINDARLAAQWALLAYDEFVKERDKGYENQ